MTTPPPPSVNIYYNKTCYGLSVDARILTRLCKTLGAGYCRELDMNEPPVMADIAFHLETPVSQVMGYAHVNVLLVNAEQWISTVYDPYIETFDLVLFRSIADLEVFMHQLEADGRRTDNLRYVPWSIGGGSGRQEKTHAIINDLDRMGFVSFLGKNEYKYEWLRDFLAAGGWTGDFPPLLVYTSQVEFADSLRGLPELPKNVTVEFRNLDSDEIDRLQWLYYGHLLCSRGEGFGYAAAEAEAHGAALLLSELPVLMEYYGNCGENCGKEDCSDDRVAWLPTIPINPNVASAAPKARRGLRYTLMGPETSTDNGKVNTEAVASAIDSLRKSTEGLTVDTRRSNGLAAAEKRWKKSLDVFESRIWNTLVTFVGERRPAHGNWCCPPVLTPDNCPPITIVTPTRNRRGLIDIAFHNLLSTDYPLQRIEWIVVEDSTNEEGASDKIINFQMNCRDITLRYIPLSNTVVGEDGTSRERVWTVGEKRNIGVEHATNDIVLFMDDDDHYPSTSFRRRVAWLQRAHELSKGGKSVVGCTTLALYDLQKGVSAVNVPPWDIPQCQRISEATLAFYKKAWIGRKFSEVSVAEGEEWIRGREGMFFEIPPQQIIVAFSTGQNSTSRRIPEVGEPNGCFWGFPGPYLRFVHGLVGVQVENSVETGDGSGGRSGAGAGARVQKQRERLQKRLAERR